MTGHRILLVEDDATTLDLLARLLRHGGHLVHTANTAEDGLAIARTAAFDLVVTDIGLPDRSGAELMREVIALYTVPGIALTGWGKEELSREDQSVFAEYLVKPVNFDELLSAIRQVTRHTPDAA
jgi:DNA-binding response OmpR family regulator